MRSFPALSPPLSMLPFHDVVKDDFDAVNRLILSELHSEVELVENIGQYLIDAGGKRLRPLVVLLAARACGYRGDEHVAMAAIIEFIHTATLLHDDVVDTSERRRGRVTANARWGNAPSVLVGDFLYSRAFQMLVRLGDMDIMHIMADTTNVISEGEVQQLINAGNTEVTETDYFQVIDKKTARLFQAAAHTGAAVAGADAGICAALSGYGHHLGMAFQLADDALDYDGDADALGKNIGDDLAEGKPTLPLIHVINTGTPEQANLVRSVIRDGSREQLAMVQQAIRETGAIDYTFQQARTHADNALASIDRLPSGSEQQALIQLAEFAYNRAF